MTTRENLGPAETIINTLLRFSDHLAHNRPGMIVPDTSSPFGKRWYPISFKNNENGTKQVFRLEQNGTRKTRHEVGTLSGTEVRDANRRLVGIYQPSGLYNDAVVWFYRQVAAVWTLHNEFAARWASYAYAQNHRDLKTILAAFLLVQSRKGDPVREGNEILFEDEDFRDVGEAMTLIQDANYLNAKLLLRIWEILHIPEIVKINHELGFGNGRKPFLGRWTIAVTKWLRYREENPKMLEGLVKSGFKSTVVALAQRVGYKPKTPQFFDILRWKQKQAKDGRRVMSIGKPVAKAESWENLSERQICNRIVKHKPSWKRIVGLLPVKVGVTRAIVAAAVENNCLSDKDLIILTPTLEDLGLVKVQEIRERLDRALAATTDARAANIAKNVRSKDLATKLEDGADKAVQREVAKVVKDLRIYFMVDVSGSMHGAITSAKILVSKFIQAFPLDRIHVAIFNDHGQHIEIKHASTRGVEQAFRGIQACGGTKYGEGVRALEHFKPQENEDTVFIFVGDEEQTGTFDHFVRNSGLRPMAFGLVKVRPSPYRIVQNTAGRLDIPCFQISENTFEDPYAIGRTIRTLIEATPVNVVRSTPSPRITLVETILNTPLLQKPLWAA